MIVFARPLPALHHGKRVELRGMDDASRAFHGRLAGNLGSGH